jgi:hypothetical protein
LKQGGQVSSPLPLSFLYNTDCIINCDDDIAAADDDDDVDAWL